MSDRRRGVPVPPRVIEELREAVVALQIAGAAQATAYRVAAAFLGVDAGRIVGINDTTGEIEIAEPPEPEAPVASPDD